MQVAAACADAALDVMGCARRCGSLGAGWAATAAGGGGAAGCVARWTGTGSDTVERYVGAGSRLCAGCELGLGW
jgi:hypothetical protein